MAPANGRTDDAGMAETVERKVGKESSVKPKRKLAQLSYVRCGKRGGYQIACYERLHDGTFRTVAICGACYPFCTPKDGAISVPPLIHGAA